MTNLETVRFIQRNCTAEDNLSGLAVWSSLITLNSLYTNFRGVRIQSFPVRGLKVRTGACESLQGRDQGLWGFKIRDSEMQDTEFRSAL